MEATAAGDARGVGVRVGAGDGVAESVAFVAALEACDLAREADADEGGFFGLATGSTDLGATVYTVCTDFVS